jgi:rhomboid family GlyGly-CTERM serine protease
LLRARDWLVVMLSSALLIDAGLYWLHPSIQWYAGLSGLLHGYWIAGCLCSLAGRDWRALPLLLLLFGKLIYEAFIGSVPMTGNFVGGPVVTQAHIWGAMGGVIGWLLVMSAARSRPRSL